MIALSSDPPSSLKESFTAVSAKSIATTTTSEVERDPYTVDELIRQRASEPDQKALVSYPHEGLEYVDYTAHQLDQFAYNAAQHYASKIPSRSSLAEPPLVVALLGPSSLDYLISMMALSKLGHTTLHLSTRISHEAYVHLLRTSGATHFIADKSMESVPLACQADIPDLQIQTVADSTIFDLPQTVEETNMTPKVDAVAQNESPVWIIHSGGSTGLPKPVFISHKAALNNYAMNMNMRGFVTSPLFHSFGICNLFRSIYARKQAHIYNARIPLTKNYLVEVMRKYNFEAFYGVPYSLEILSEDPEGIKLLANCKAVIYSGAACPDEVGDRLVENGVPLISHWGSTETGGLMTSVRSPEDKEWNWMRPSATAAQYLRMEPRGDDLHEAVCLPGWPSKVMSNRPDGSYAMKDLFIKHPDPNQNRWKYYGRLDDTIVLVNGEKAMPLPVEGAARQHPHVKEALVFGKGRDRLGLAVIRSPESLAISDAGLAESVISSLQETMAKLPAYARISSDMVLVLGSDTDYPRTDKNTVIRIRFYKHFEKEIDSIYEAQNKPSACLQLDEDELRSFIRKVLQDVMPASESIGDSQDLFNAGMDSLQATQLRAAIAKQIDIGQKHLGINIAFEYPSIEQLAQYLYILRMGTGEASSFSVEDRMRSLIQKYSIFRAHKSQVRNFQGRYIVLTGATGSLGAHIAHILAHDTSIRKVYCLCRASSLSDADNRITKSLNERGICLPEGCREKLVGLPADLSQPSLGLNLETLSEIQSNVCAIIHSAWSVNFNLSLSSFEDCIAGAHNLMQLCLDTKAPSPASFSFCSSISTVMRTAMDTIAESIPPLQAAQNMGYAQSKLSTEHVCQIASSLYSLPTQVLRIGQIVGDSQHGIWNKQEAIPMMLQTSKTLGALPVLDENVRWLPVDVVAQSCVDISFSQNATTCSVYNILNANTMHWTNDLLPTLREAGLSFDELTPSAWLEKLRISKQDPSQNPPVKLLEFWAAKYGKETKKVEYNWDTANVAQASVAFRESTKPSNEHVQQILKYFQEHCW